MKRLILAIAVLALVGSAGAGTLIGAPHASKGPRADALTCGGNSITYYILTESVWVRLIYPYEAFATFELRGPNFMWFDVPPVPGWLIGIDTTNLDPGIYYGTLTTYSSMGVSCSFTRRFRIP